MKMDIGDSDEQVEEGLIVALINTELDLYNERVRVHFLEARIADLERDNASLRAMCSILSEELTGGA